MIAPQVGESCKSPVFSCNEGFDFNEMLSHTSQSVYITSMVGVVGIIIKIKSLFFQKLPGLRNCKC